MAQTIRDFIVECEMFPYSKAYFELMHDEAEIKILDKYIENYEFTRDYDPMISDLNLNESYFMEALSDEQYEALLEEAEQKKAGLIEKIKNLLKAAIEKLSAAFNNFLKAIVNMKKVIPGIIESLSKITINNEAYQSLHQVFDASAKTEGGTFMIAPGDDGELRNQPFSGTLGGKMKFADEVDKKQQDAMIDMFAQVLGDEVYVDRILTAVSAEELQVPKLMYPDEFEKLKRSMQGVRRITINTDEADIKRKLSLFKKQQDYIKGGLKTKEIQENQFTQHYPELVKMIGDTTLMYSQYINYRRRVVVDLTKWFSANEDKYKEQAAHQ